MVAVADQSNSQMFREYRSPIEWPWPLMTLVQDARRVLSYFEVPEDKRPPQAIWHSGKKCADWIKKAFDEKASKPNEMSFDDVERE